MPKKTDAPTNVTIIPGNDGAAAKPLPVMDSRALLLRSIADELSVKPRYASICETLRAIADNIDKE
jgi:hypothetical protein